MIKDFEAKIMGKVSEIFKEMEASVETYKDKKVWIRNKAKLWLIVDDLCDRWKELYNKVKMLEQDKT